MSEKLKNSITVFLACTVLLGFFLAFIIFEDKDFSDTERRKLNEMPDFTVSAVTSGKFMTDFRDYVSDQFPFRDSLRSIKAYSSDKLFNMSDNNGYYFYDQHISEIEYPLDSASLERAAKIFTDIYDRDLKDNNTKVYLSVIPDKNFLLAEKSGHLSIDYKLLADSLKNKMAFANYVDIYDLMDLSDFYYTDLHIRQECAVDIANRLCEQMDAKIQTVYNEVVSHYSFYGVYYGHSALNTKPDTLKYLTNDTIKNCKVYDYETQRYVGVYDLEALNSNDAYSVFLHGSKSLLRIENPNANNNKKLVIFRDSFASNITPLMLEGYSEITLVDIRYISATTLSNFIDFSDSDILFLYSTSVLNNSITLKK